MLIACGDRPVRGLPGIAPETLVVDHGRIYVSVHLRSVCQRLGISIQQARPFQPTDKAVVERIFRTIGEDLLAALPGYKGPDVYGRGEHSELEAYYFVDELELIIREWVAERYHRRPHQGLVLAEVPGLELCPNDAATCADRKLGHTRWLATINARAPRAPSVPALRPVGDSARL